MSAAAYVTQAQVLSSPAFTTMAAAPAYTTMAAAPAYTTVVAAPAAQYVSAAPQYVSAAPAVEVDKVNAFGQVVERDIVGGAVMAAPQITYGAPITQTFAAPAVEYVSAAPAVQYVSTVAAPAVEVDQVNALGQVVERDFVGGALTAAPQITYGSPITQTYAAPAVQYVNTVAAPAVEVDQVNAVGQVVERDFVGGGVVAAPQITYGAPIMQTYAAPAVEYVNAAPAVQYVNTVAAPAVEVDQVNAFGQVVERDVVQAAPALVTAAPKYVSPPPMAGSSSILGTRKAAPLQLNTKAFQANLPSPYTMLPDYVAPETVAAPVSDLTAASMTASPSMSAMQGPFVFTAGAAYIGAPEKIIASAPKAEKAPPKAEKAPEKAPAKKGGVTKTKKGKRGCC